MVGGAIPAVPASTRLSARLTRVGNTVHTTRARVRVLGPVYVPGWPAGWQQGLQRAHEMATLAKIKITLNNKQNFLFIVLATNCAVGWSANYTAGRNADAVWTCLAG